jgi:DNA repair photolyase
MHSPQSHPRSGTLKGRGTATAPHNRFETVRRETDWEQLAADDELLGPPPKTATQFLADKSSSLITENTSPDVPFRYSLNAYRGCEHGCAYCFARPFHELLGMNAGLDFETKIMVKFDAVKLLRRELNKPSWQGELLAMSGVTDCYQPAERQYRLTRGVLEVMHEANQAVAIVTKNALVLRDGDLLSDMARRNLVHVCMSITTLDAQLASVLEPRTSSPQARLRAVRELSAAGVPVRVLMAPLIPGLTDHEVPSLLEAVHEAGAQAAGYVLLRLPHAVAPIFQDWLAQHRPLASPRIEGLIRGSREGALYDSQWGTRMRGTGAYADHLQTTFTLFQRKFGLDRELPAYDCSQFRPPRSESGQQLLF